MILFRNQMFSLYYNINECLYKNKNIYFNLFRFRICLSKQAHIYIYVIAGEEQKI